MKNLKSNSLFVLFVLFSFSGIFGQSPFVTIWKTDNSGTSDDSQIIFPASGEYSYEWIEMGNPANTETGTAVGEKTFEFPNPGTYQLSITPSGNNPFHRIEFNNEGDKEKILGVANWGDVVWSSFENAFYGARYMIVPATDAPNLNNVTSMKRAFAMTENFNHPIEHWDMGNITDITAMFAGNPNFNQPLNGWDVSNVIFMAETFANAFSFNQPLDNWDVSNAERMSTMFFGAKEFNQSLENWDLSNVETVEGMFAEASNFNQPLENWNMSNVEVISGMFYQATSFNQPLEGWDISNVKYSAGMFDGANSFNQPLNNWDTGNIEVMATMFANNNSFNQPLDNWDVSKVWLSASMFQNASNFNQNLDSWKFNSLEVADSMFNNSGMGCENYSLLIHAWANNPDLAENVIFGATGMEYSPEVVDDRAYLISELNWNITGDQSGSCSVGLGLPDVNEMEITVFPNPASSFITISGNFEYHEFSVFDMSGRAVISGQPDSGSIDISDLSEGVYFLRLKTTEERSITKKIIVER